MHGLSGLPCWKSQNEVKLWWTARRKGGKVEIWFGCTCRGSNLNDIHTLGGGWNLILWYVQPCALYPADTVILPIAAAWDKVGHLKRVLQRAFLCFFPPRTFFSDLRLLTSLTSCDWFLLNNVHFQTFNRGKSPVAWFFYHPHPPSIYQKCPPSFFPAAIW